MHMCGGSPRDWPAELTIIYAPYVVYKAQDSIVQCICDDKYY